ncbi:MAG: gliding motility-associated C-terminal domain-containing protein, partial [Bacteroidia bacterium]
VTDSNTCKNTIEINVEEEACDPVFSNIITPNGDGLNDGWEILNFDKSFSHMVQIFNRWGQAVLETNNYDNDNPGNRWKGEDLPDGTYYYIVKYVDKKYSGIITKITSDKK